MKCPDLRDRLSFFLDGECDEETARSLGRHLEECPGCRRLVEAHREVQRLVEGIPEEAPGTPDPRAIQAASPPGRAPLRLLHPVLATAAVLLLLLALPWMFRSPNSLPPPSPGPARPAATGAQCLYSIGIAGSTYRVALEGEGARLLAFGVSEGDGDAINLWFNETARERGRE